MKIFIPWQATGRTYINTEKKLILPKRSDVLEDACFHNLRAPYVCLPNPNGIMRSFLSALEKEKEEEAMGYLSQTVSQLADLDEMKKLFLEKEIRFFSHEKGEEMRRLSLACQTKDGKTEMLCIGMVAEPDEFGKWKICSIERE